MTRDEAVNIFYDAGPLARSRRCRKGFSCAPATGYILASAFRTEVVHVEVGFDGRVQHHSGRHWQRIARRVRATLRFARQAGVDIAAIRRALGDAPANRGTAAPETLAADKSALIRLAEAMADAGTVGEAKHIDIGWYAPGTRIDFMVRGVRVHVDVTRDHADAPARVSISVRPRGVFGHLRKYAEGFAAGATVAEAMRGAVLSLGKSAQSQYWYNGGNSYRTGLTQGARRWLRDLARRVPPNAAEAPE